jgi:molecular chaperone GrpE
MPKKKDNINEKNEWQTKAEEYLAAWQRVQADLVNYRKRSDEEKAAFIKYANLDFILAVLPVFDNFKRAAIHTPETEDSVVKNWVEGVKAIEKQFEQVLSSIGVTQIMVNEGDEFNPNKHEALVSEVSDLPEDSIVSEIEYGYMYNDRVIRPSKVKVSKGSTQEAANKGQG